MALEADYGLVVSVLGGIIRGDPTVQMLMAQPEFRESILLRERHVQQKLAVEINGDADEEELSQAAEDPGFVMELIAGRSPDEGRSALDKIRAFLRGAERATICDPYLFGGSPSRTFESGLDYAQSLARAIPSSVKQLRVFTSSHGSTSPQANAIRKRLKFGRSLEVIETDAVHDRYILRGREAGLMLGASISGLGGKISTIAHLPPGDLLALHSALDQLRS